MTIICDAYGNSNIKLKYMYYAALYYFASYWHKSVACYLMLWFVAESLGKTKFEKPCPTLFWFFLALVFSI